MLAYALALRYDGSNHEQGSFYLGGQLRDFIGKQ
jgi:hypothetical protein